MGFIHIRRSLKAELDTVLGYFVPFSSVLIRKPCFMCFFGRFLRFFTKLMQQRIALLRAL